LSLHEQHCAPASLDKEARHRRLFHLELPNRRNADDEIFDGNLCRLTPVESRIFPDQQIFRVMIGIVGVNF